MPLSEYEQRVLEQLERDLNADPKLGRTMVTNSRSRGRIAVGVLGVLIGLAVVLIGVVAAVIPLGIGGFALMIAAAMWALFAPAPSHKQPRGRGQRLHAVDAKKRTKEAFLRRVENRLERRRERGDF